MATMVSFDLQICPEELVAAPMREYFVRGITYMGGRHYSESLPWEDAVIRYNEYRDIVKYFGGGYIELAVSNYDDYDVLMNDWVV